MGTSAGTQCGDRLKIEKTLGTYHWVPTGSSILFRYPVLLFALVNWGEHWVPALDTYSIFTLNREPGPTSGRPGPRGTGYLTCAPLRDPVPEVPSANRRLRRSTSRENGTKI